MLYANNPEIDFDQLASQIAENVRLAKPCPPLLVGSLPDLRAANDALLAIVANAERQIASDRTFLRWLARFGAIGAFLANRLRLRDNDKHLALIDIVRAQIAVNQQLAAQITVLTDHVSRDA
jgi:hypothetical protein